jgi:hypothetical protein
MSIKSVSAYPLTWPDGWPRTPDFERVRARFNRTEKQYVAGVGGPGYSYNTKKTLSVSDSVKRVRESLMRLAGVEGQAIISTNMPVRNDGLPRSDAKAPADPGVAVYWEINGKPMQVMAIDQYDRVADNLAAIAATLEAMRAIERHGGAQILERAFTGFQALPAPAGGRPWRTVLEIDTNYSFTLDDAENQYRRLRSVHHPDKPGGSATKFHELQVAIEQARRELK